MREEAIAKLVSLMKENGLDAVLVCPSGELKYLIGFSPMMCERFQGLFIKNDGSRFYLCNKLYASELGSAFKDLKIVSWYDWDFMADAVKGLLEAEGLLGKRIGVNSSAPAFSILDIAEKTGITFVNARLMLEETRIIKSNEDLENLRIAAQIADKAFDSLIKYIKPGMTEAGLRDFASSEMVRFGGTRPWGLVACGPNSSYPHYSGSDGVVGFPDVVLFDFGCSYNNMASDISRMIFVGEPTGEQRGVYDICRKSTEAGEAACFEGAYIPDIDKAARGVITDAGYGETFYYRLGHGIGYMGHEAPDIKASNPRRLQKGMSFSIEPGINLTGRFGMRVEDVVAITDSGTEVLNKSTHDMVIVTGT